MQLIYRAVRYEVNPTDIQSTDKYRIGIYRGVKINIPAPVITHQTRSHRILKYRGATYAI